MEHHLLKSASLVALTLFSGACALNELGSGCSRANERGGTGTAEVTSSKSAAADPARNARAREWRQPKRPWADNTGPYNRKTLMPSEALMIETDGAVYENIDVKGDIWIDADNVTIRNFRIDAAGEYYGIKVLDGHRGVLLEDGEIFGMTSAGVLGVGYTARRLHIHDSSGDGMKAEGESPVPTVVEYCFIEKLGSSEEAHADGNQTRGGANITFRYNNIFLPSPDTPKYPGLPYKSNAAFMLELGITNFVIEHNWLTGGSYTIYCGTDDGGVSVRNNVFGRDNDGLQEGKEGRHLVDGKCDEWKGNVWEDTGGPA